MLGVVSSHVRTLAVLGMITTGSACGGSPFGGSDEAPSQSGGSGSVGTSGDAHANAGEGGEASGTGGASPSSAGTSPTEAGSSATDGGASPGAGGGNSGAAGESGEPEVPIFTMSKLLDDMEDGNATLLEGNGDWFVFKDTTAGTITPAKGDPFAMSALTPARGKSTRAASVTVSGFTEWGAAFGFDFAYTAGVRQPTDLKEALAIRFWAKASKATTVRFQMANADTDPLGGKCDGAGDNACNAHWTRAFKVDNEWKETTVVFADLKQDLPGRHVPTFDKQHVYSSFFIIGPNQAVTVWVDDVALVH
jgi:Carbohydrate binding domain (family 11)